MDELSCDTMSEQCVKILSRAAEISPFVTERTLGPDLQQFVCKGNASLLQATNSNGASEKENSNNTTLPEKCQQISQNSIQLNSSFEYSDYMSFCSAILLREAEDNRKKCLKKQLVERWDKQINNDHQYTAKHNQIISDREKWFNDKQKNDSFILQEAEKQTTQMVKDNEKEIDLLRKQTQRTIQAISFQAIAQYQNRFRCKYEQIAKLLLSINSQSLLKCEDYNLKLKDFIQMFDQLISKIKNSDCNDGDLKIAENLCRSLNQLEESILKELDAIVSNANKAYAEAKEQEARAQEQQHREQLEKEKIAQKEIEAMTVPVPVQAEVHQVDSTQNQITQSTPTTGAPAAIQTSSETGTTRYASKERFAFYTHINTFYLDKVEKVKPLQSDENMKKYRFACQKAINIPVNAISAVSAHHLQDKFEKLYNFISGQPLSTNDGKVSVNDHPLGRDYCILLMAKKFVGQGDSAVSSNAQAAFPLASVIVSLWRLVPDFGQIFLAYVFKESPFLVPYFIPQKHGQSDEEYYKTLGYRIADGKLEQQDMYLKRQSGIARLYAAVMITNGRKNDGSYHPYSIENGWRWLTNFINLEPLPDICATLIMEMLQFIGADMWAAYRLQFVKLLLAIQQQYFPKLSTVDEGGPKARLEILLGKVIREGQISRPQGLLQVGFW